MKLTKGTKPEKAPNISLSVPHTITQIGNYIEIEITDLTEITKLKSKGFK